MRISPIIQKTLTIYIIFSILIIGFICLALPDSNIASKPNTQPFPKAHNTIEIRSNSQFTTSNGVVKGVGTINNPYIIENWLIDATKNSGIHIQDTTKYFIIRNCLIYNGTNGSFHPGIFLFNSDNGIIENNTLILNSYGIWLRSSDYISISDNNITNCYIDILYQKSRYSQISNNKMNSRGISFEGLGGGLSLSDWNSHVIDKFNLVSGKPIYYFKDLTSGIVPTGAGQIILANCSNMIINNLTINNKTFGLALGYSNNNLISNCTFSSNIFGIYLEHSNFNRIYNNTLYNNSEGLHLDYSNSNKIINNNCNSQRSSGIRLRYSDSNIISNNTYESNGKWGIFLYVWSHYNIISNNSCNFNKEYGIRIDGTNNIIVNNTCISNGKIGIYGGYNNNKVYNNIFINNNNYYSKWPDNIWNITKILGKNIIGGSYLGGNFWSNYTGVDNNDDGLGDTNLPYGPGDYCPLVDVFGPNCVDNTTGIPTTGEQFIIKAIAWDNLLIDKVKVNYWFDNNPAQNMTLDRIDGTFRNGTYAANITIPDSCYNMYYLINSTDMGGYWNRTEIKRLDVIDNDKPFMIDQPGSPTTGDSYTFNISVTDNINVSGVYLEFWCDNNSHQNVSLSTNKTNYFYKINIPSNAKYLSYNISAVDNSSNWESLNCLVLNVKDNDAPTLFDNATPSFSTTGEPLTFKVNCTDNLEIQSGIVLYRYGNDVPFSSVDLERSNLTFSTNIITDHTLTPVNYYFRFKDTSNNFNNSSQNLITIIDNDKPELIGDLSDTIAYTNTTFNFSLNIKDNIEPISAAVEYNFKKSRQYSFITLIRNGNYFNGSILIPNSIEKLNYRFIFNDSNPDNTNSSSFKQIEVHDSEEPRIITGSGDIQTTTGESFELFVKFSDNIGISLVKIFYSKGDIWLEKVLPSSLNGNYTINNAELSIDTTNDVSSWSYYFYAQDTSQNFNYYGSDQNSYLIIVTDNDKPIANAGDDFIVDLDQSVIFNGINSTDNIGIIDYLWTFNYNGKKISLNGPITEFKFQKHGKYDISLNVSDAANNWNTDSITIDVNIPKIIMNYPENNAVINKTHVILKWHLNPPIIDYYRFDLYFGVDEDPGSYVTNVSSTVFHIENLLPGETYYWSIQLSILNSINKESIRNFKIKTEDVKHGVKIYSEFESIDIAVGNSKLVNLTIKNTGNTIDVIYLKIEKGKFQDDIKLEQVDLELLSMDFKKIMMIITTTKSAPIYNYTITVIATSIGAKEFGYNLSDSVQIKIRTICVEEDKAKIIMPDYNENLTFPIFPDKYQEDKNTKPHLKNDFVVIFIPILVIISFIIVISVTLIFLRKIKKRNGKQKTESTKTTNKPQDLIKQPPKIAQSLQQFSQQNNYPYIQNQSQFFSSQSQQIQHMNQTEKK